MLLHRSDLNISAKFRQTFSHFSAIFCKIWSFSLNFAQNLMKISRNLSFQTDPQAKCNTNNYCRKCWTLNIPEFFGFLMNSSKISWILKQCWPNSNLNSSNGSVHRRSNLSTQLETPPRVAQRPMPWPPAPPKYGDCYRGRRDSREPRARRKRGTRAPGYAPGLEKKDAGWI